MRGSKCSRELLLNCKSVCCNGFLLQKAYKKTLDFLCSSA